MSNSGRERNCCFLNNGRGWFANVSAAIGLDHIGDGRAYALTDWDHDGDLDLWATNRTGPRVQFFNNNGVPGNHYVGLRLQGNGTSTNRDAIGARVELVVPKDEGRRIQVVRAGEGFVSQSSKTILFGLGKHEIVDKILVNWPGGEQEEFLLPAVDRHYLLVQGSGRPRPWVRPGGEAELIAAAAPTVDEGGEGRVQLRYRIPTPTVQYETLDGGLQSLDLDRGQPTLINLWASWCQPCLRELADFRKHEAEFQTHGLNVLALSVDKLAEDATSNPEAAIAFVKRQQFSFDAGFATQQLMSTLDALHYFLYEVQRHTSVPSSLLFDAKGRLAVVYVGRAEVDQILADVERLALGDLPWFESALPYAGNWLKQPPQPELASLVDAFVERGLAEQARQYFDRYGDVLAHSSRLPDLLMQLGATVGNQGDLDEAGRRFQQALEADPNNAGAHLQLSKVYLMQQQPELALEHGLQATELRPDFEEAHFVLASLYENQGKSDEVVAHLQSLVQINPQSTKYHMLLGSAYARDENWPAAVEQFRQAVAISPDRAETHLQLALALEKSGDKSAAQESFAEVGRLDPSELKRQFMLAVGLAEAGKVDRAIEHFRLAQRLDPESPFTMNALAWLLATREDSDTGDYDEALQLAKAAAEKTRFSHPQLLDTLAAAFAAAGEFPNAASAAERAIAIAERSKNTELAGKIRSRLQLYQQRKPYRLSDSN